MKKLHLLAALLVCGVCFSQQTIQNQRVWFSYFGQYKVSEKWGFHVEAQFRLDNELQQNVQNLFRAGAIYYLSPKDNVTVGYGLINTYNPSLDTFFKENRMWEQYQYNHKWNDNKNTMLHRLRLEQRWVERLAVSSENTTNYQNRLRYFNRNLIHISNLRSEKAELYAVVQDEIFLNLGDNKINSTFFDQNRFLVGLGLNSNNHTRLELGYMNQFVTSSTGNDSMNHVVSVSLFHNLDLQKQ